MSYQTYDIIFSGQLLEGCDLEIARQQIAKIFRANEAQLDKLFSGNPVVIKSGADDETATKYHLAFRKAGAIVEIRLSAPPADIHTPSPQATEGLTLMPANTGSLIDCAKPVTPQPIPDITYMSLADPGTIIDESAKPEPVEIDTSAISMTAPNTGSLEDCKKEVKPYPIPDISHLDIDKG